MPRPTSITLNNRDLRILRLLNRGLTLAEIAKALGKTVPAINGYIGRLHPKFGVNERYALILEARRRGIIETPKRGARPRWLTRTRLRLLELAQQDLSHAEIATRVGKKQGAVDKLFEYIRKELGARTTLEAVDIAVRDGLLPGAAPTKLRNPITPRDADFLNLLARGLTVSEMQRELGLRSVSGRLRKMRTKLRVSTNDELLDAVERLGLHHFAHRATRVPRKGVEQIARHRNPEPLTPREREVQDLLRRFPQATYTELADRLGVCRGLVTQYAWRLKRFYAVRTREDLQDKLRG